MSDKFLKKQLTIKGFTLIELLVVISLIGVLISISLVAYSSTRKSARDSKRKADLEQIRSALEMYRSDVGLYPETLNFGGSLSYGSDVYMASVPTDPLPSSYQYRYNGSANAYTLCAFLETGGQVASCSGDCGGSCGSSVCNYKACNP